MARSVTSDDQPHLRGIDPVDGPKRRGGDGSVVLSEPRESLLLLAESVLTRVRASKDR